MEIGKLPNKLLKEIILDKIKNRREEVILSSGIGEDCGALNLGDSICVVSSDPITGAENNIGTLAINISCNDIAASGAEPIALTVTILAPPYATRDSINTIMEQLSSEAEKLNVDIIGGHTEVTDAVNRFVISTTCIGKAAKGKLVSASGAAAGDMLILTKHAGMEGASIIANDRESQVKCFLDTEALKEARSYIDRISVVKEGIIAAGEGASAMHDVTEGGVLGAVWELGEASGVGAEIYAEHIPVRDVTRRICKHYDIDPLRLISSGCMLIAIKESLVARLMKRLSEEEIESAVIGKVTDSSKRILKSITSGNEREIFQPESDELYKVLNNKNA